LNPYAELIERGNPGPVLDIMIHSTPTERIPMNIYVGNLSFKTTEKGLKEVFETFGVVKSAKIIMDGFTGKSKGFGFVEMPDNVEAKAAINGMNGREFEKSPLKVNEAKPREVPSNRTRLH
jgi:RNA recognition motif-containing protein